MYAEKVLNDYIKRSEQKKLNRCRRLKVWREMFTQVNSQGMDMLSNIIRL